MLMPASSSLVHEHLPGETATSGKANSFCGPDLVHLRVHSESTPQVRVRPVRRPLPSLAQQRLAAGQPFVEPAGNLSLGYYQAKRLLDVVGALVLLVVLAPVMAAVFLILLVTTRGKPLYFQRRVGYLGRPFTMVKFRTMRPDADRIKHTVANEQAGPVFKNRRDPRVTRLGRILRKTSLDETPQLFQVLAGKMSLVGPRPLLASEVARFEPWQRRRLSVMPGLTCLWQVSGRSQVNFEQWMRMDLWYVKNQSLWTDLKLLLRTPWSVVTGRGAY